MTDDARLLEIVAATPWLVGVLEAVRAVGPPRWYVAAGAIRNTVWNALSGRPCEEPTGDIDVVYFDAVESDGDGWARYEARLRSRLPAYDWQVTNQAVVHRWQSSRTGRTLAPYPSVAAALATWPETATAVGVTLDSRGEFSVLAPLGLRDLLTLTVRPNPDCVDRDAYRKRLQEKRWKDRWPSLAIVSADEP